MEQLPGKEIQIEWDAEGGYYLVLMVLEDGESEILATPGNLETAEDLAYRCSMPGIEYVSPNICRVCKRNMPWTINPLPDKDLLCEICSLSEHERGHCWLCGRTMRRGWRSHLCSSKCRYWWDEIHGAGEWE